MPRAPAQYRPAGQAKRRPSAAGRPSHQRHVKKWMQSERWKRYYSWFWQQEKNNNCRHCNKDLAENREERCLDHITSHKGDAGLFWDTENHQPLCTSCHNRKTARERRVERNNPPPPR